LTEELVTVPELSTTEAFAAAGLRLIRAILT